MLSTLLGGPVKRRQRLSAEGDRSFWPFSYNSTSSGQVVNPITAMRVAAVYACVRVLSETLASAPCITYRKGPKGRVRATELPIYGVLHDQPNQWQSSFEFWEMCMSHLALRGNFYCVIVPGSKGAVTELFPLHPDRIKVERQDNGRLRYTFTDMQTGQPETYTQDEIFHVRGLSRDGGLTGTSIIQNAEETIGGAMAADKYNSSYFKNDATPGMVLATEQPLTAEARNETAAMWNKRHAGSENAHRTAVLSNGLKPMPLSVTNRDSQFIELRQFGRSEIASAFRVPPHLIGDLERATFSNIEQQSLEFVMYTMLPWFRRIEAAINRDLMVSEGVFAEFLIDGLLRGDQATRSAFYREMRNIGVLNANEIRERENLNDMGPEGDAYLVQGAMITLDRAINPPAPQPFARPPQSEEDQSDEVKAKDDKEDAAETQDLKPIYALVHGAIDAKDEVIKSKDAVIVSKDLALMSAEELIKLERERAATAERAALEKTQDHKAADEMLQHVSGKLQIALRESEQALQEAHNKSVQLAEMLHGAKRLAVDELRGLVRVEINAMQRASHKHDFLSAIDKFYGEHRLRIAESMRGPLELLRLAGGGNHESEALAAAHCDQSLAALLEAAGACNEKQLPETVSNLMAGWEQRAAFLEN